MDESLKNVWQNQNAGAERKITPDSGQDGMEKCGKEKGWREVFGLAYLNEAEDSVTICPQYFLSEKGRMYQADYPKNWIRIENAKGKQGLR